MSDCAICRVFSGEQSIAGPGGLSTRLLRYAGNELMYRTLSFKSKPIQNKNEAKAIKLLHNT